MTTKVWNDISRDSLRMVQFTAHPDGRMVRMRNGELMLFEKHSLLPEEAFTDIREPVELLDELLKAGYRPSDNKWAGGHVKALENHVAFAELVARKGDYPFGKPKEGVL